MQILQFLQSVTGGDTEAAESTDAETDQTVEHDQQNI